jgi:thiol-disulfide isomerase/thioredoxin
MSGRRAKRERVALALTAVVLVAAAAATIALTRGGSTSATGTSARGNTGAALQLSGTDLISGSQVSLSNYIGKRIVLNLWASWCTGCYAEARALAIFGRSHPQAQVIGVDIEDTRAGAKAFYRRFGWHHPSIFDPTGAVAARLQLQGLPATLFLDRRHHVVARILGATDLAGFEAGFRRTQT